MLTMVTWRGCWLWLWLGVELLDIMSIFSHDIKSSIVIIMVFVSLECFKCLETLNLLLLSFFWWSKTKIFAPWLASQLETLAQWWLAWPYSLFPLGKSWFLKTQKWKNKITLMSHLLLWNYSVLTSVRIVLKHSVARMSQTHNDLDVGKIIKP